MSRKLTLYARMCRRPKNNFSHVQKIAAFCPLCKTKFVLYSACIILFQHLTKIILISTKINLPIMNRASEIFGLLRIDCNLNLKIHLIFAFYNLDQTANQNKIKKFNEYKPFSRFLIPYFQFELKTAPYNSNKACVLLSSNCNQAWNI